MYAININDTSSFLLPGGFSSPSPSVKKKRQWSLHKLWQHNRGNYTTPTIYQKIIIQRKINNTLDWSSESHPNTFDYSSAGKKTLSKACCKNRPPFPKFLYLSELTPKKKSETNLIVLQFCALSGLFFCPLFSSRGSPQDVVKGVGNRQRQTISPLTSVLMAGKNVCILFLYSATCL